MDNPKYPELKQVVVEAFANSALKKDIQIKETEIVYPANIENDIKIEGRVGKKKQPDAEEFREKLYDIVAEKIGSEQATAFINENFDIEIGLGEGEKFQGIDSFNLNGEKVTIMHNLGQVLMIDFWATWCGYCQDPMQENVDLMANNKTLTEKNIQIVGLSCDDDTNAWKAHINERVWTTIPQYIKSGVLKEVGIKGIPCIAIVGLDGVIAYWGHPSSINLQESLLALAEGKPVKKPGEEGSSSVPSEAWLNMDAQSKMTRVAEINFMMKDAGVVNASFCVQTKFSFDQESSQMKVAKTTPIFYGQVSQFEYETLQTLATTIQDSNGFNDFAFNVRVIQMNAEEEF